MPLTVITLKNVPPSLRGDLTKWMQEIATGVYIGNFNPRIRERLWNRICENTSIGEATLSYATRNEIGYTFETLHTKRQVINNEGLPLVLLPAMPASARESSFGFSEAAKHRMIKKQTSARERNKIVHCYTVIDVETDGVEVNTNHLIELGAVRMEGEQQKEFHCLIIHDSPLPPAITQLTGISAALLKSQGTSLENALQEFVAFVGDTPLVGYNIDFDMRFLQKALSEVHLQPLTNRTYDLLRFVKKENMFLDNYKLQTVLAHYGIQATVIHRALDDARLTYELSTKVNEFLCRLK